MKAADEGVRGFTKMHSLGAATARMLKEVGVNTPQDLRAIGAIEAWRRLRFTFGRRVTRSYLYALESAITETRWNDLSAKRVRELRAAADDIAARMDATLTPSATGKRKRS